MHRIVRAVLSLTVVLTATPAFAEAPLCTPCDAERAVRALRADPEPESYGKAEGLIPGVVVGPKLGLVSLPIPAAGVELKALNLVGASFDYGLIPTVNIEDVKGSARTWNVAAKVYPFRGAFFVGAAYGQRTVTAKKKDFSSLSPTASEARLDVRTTFLAPELGWRWVWRTGFFTGVELAWQFPLSNRIDVSANVSDSVRSDLQDIADVAKRGLPSLGLFQLGWFL